MLGWRKVWNECIVSSGICFFLKGENVRIAYACGRMCTVCLPDIPAPKGERISFSFLRRIGYETKSLFSLTKEMGE